MTRRSLAVACADLQAVLRPGWRSEIWAFEQARRLARVAAAQEDQASARLH